MTNLAKIKLGAALLITLLAVGSTVATLAAKNRVIEKHRRAIKNQQLRIKLQDDLYDTLDETLAKTEKDYDNLSQNYFNWKNRAETLEGEKERRISVSRGGPRKLRGQRAGGSAPASNLQKRIRDCESGGKGMAARNGSHIGSYQFKQSTFDSYKAAAGVPGGSVYSGQDQEIVAGWMISRGLSYHWRACGG